jgi:hypothetical protein
VASSVRSPSPDTLDDDDHDADPAKRDRYILENVEPDPRSEQLTHNHE